MCVTTYFSILRISPSPQVANAGDDVLIFYNDHSFNTLLKLMKEDRDDAVSLTGESQTSYEYRYILLVLSVVPHTVAKLANCFNLIHLGY